MFAYRTIKEGKPQTNTNSKGNSKAFYGRKSKELSHYLAEVFALFVCFLLFVKIRFTLEKNSPPQDKSQAQS